MNHKFKIYLVLIIAALSLTACGGSGPGALQAFPTSESSNNVSIESTALPADYQQTPVATINVPITPTPPQTAPPAVVVPNTAGVSVACEANTLRIPLGLLPGSGIHAVTRIAADGEWLYLLIDGGLYRADRVAVDTGKPELERILLPGDDVAGRPVQDLVDVTVDHDRGRVYVLDKVGHIFRYEPASKQKSITYRIDPNQDFEDGLSNQVVALEIDDRGRPILLDTAHGILWTTEGISSLVTVNESRGLTSGVDVASAGGKFYILRNDNVIRRVSNDVGSDLWQEAEGRRLALSLTTSDHLGIDVLYVVDGLRREVVGVLPDSGQEVTRLEFGFIDMSLLRDVVFAGGRLYAVAGTDLFVYPGPATSADSTDCSSPDMSAYTRPTLYGNDILPSVRGLQFPIEEGELPPWPRVYPGATRIYRLGVHHGLDIYSYNAPRGFKKGWPVVAMADGEVQRATLVYLDMTEEEYDQIVAQAEIDGYTSDESLTRLSGKQVIIDHGNGLRTVYSHLDEIAPGVVTGATVRAGQIIGTVGVTGTEGEVRTGSVGPHLHFEILIDDIYLGRWLTIRETMWWYEQIFGTTNPVGG